VERLYEKLRRKGKRLSRATIYRNLPLLRGSGLIKDVLARQKQSSYEHIFGHDHHDHLLCIKCGRLIEFSEEKIERLQETICKRYGFTSVEHTLAIKGYCKRCK
jgi:Fur family ferric uptake transcriptional regulator